MQIQYSIIIPTYRRPDILHTCLDELTRLDYESSRIEIRIYDNGAPTISDDIAKYFAGMLPLTYVLNPPGHGLGYSLKRGVRESCGRRIIELNDDALVPPDLLKRLDAIFDSDPKIGVAGVRAIEDNYYGNGQSIGTIDIRKCEIIGNFNISTDRPMDVDHVYGFCYAYTRELVDRGGHHDEVLLSKDYSSGNRLETDHCLTARRLGFRVVYDSSIAVRHLAKPRGDMNERSLRWHLNHVRNTLYLYLKHFGLFGRQSIAFRFAFLKDVGIISALRHPTKANWMYFLNGLHARLSAFLHYLKYLIRESLPTRHHIEKKGELS